MSGAAMASLLVENLAAMEALAATQPATFVAIIGPEGLLVVLPASRATKVIR